MNTQLKQLNTEEKSDNTFKQGYLKISDFIEGKNEVPVKELQVMLDDLYEEYKLVDAKAKYYEELLRLEKARKFGKSSEKKDPNQITMDEISPESFSNFDEVEATIAEAEKPVEEPEIKTVVRRKKGNVGASKECFKGLETKVVVHDLPEEEKKCAKCGNDLHVIGKEIREEIEIVPVKFIKVIHETYIYGCRNCEKEGTEGAGIVKQNERLPLFPGSFASPSLVSWIICKKYWLKEPVYRLEKEIETLGFDLSRTTMCNWTVKAAQMYLEGLYDALHKDLLTQEVIHADETPFRVLERNGEKTDSTSYMWYYTSGQIEKHQICLYEYSPTRSGEVPKQFLEGFSGVLQTDGYKGYNKVDIADRCGCLAHAKRKFNDAVKSLEGSDKRRMSVAEEGLQFFSKIFSLEKNYPRYDADERLRLRKEQVQPVIEALKSWLEKNRTKVSPKSKLGEAIKYCLNNWELLIYFLNDGRVEATNNKAERGMKEFVIGRKNYLFSAVEKGAHTSGILLSIVETAKANSLNPFEYIKYALEELSQNKQTDEKIQEILPWSDKLPDKVKVHR